MSTRLWWRLRPALLLAEHAVRAPHSRHTLAQEFTDQAVQPSLLWTVDSGIHFLESNGNPPVSDQDGIPNRVPALSWVHAATGITGNPVQLNPGWGILPLRGHVTPTRRTRPLIADLRDATALGMHWFGVHPDPSGQHGRHRYTFSTHRGDILPPDTRWVEGVVSCPQVGGLPYPAWLADGYQTCDGALALFDWTTVHRMVVANAAAAPTVDAVYRTMLTWSDDVLIIDRPGATGSYRWSEADRVPPTGDGLYPVGAYQWTWRRQ